MTPTGVGTEAMRTPNRGFEGRSYVVLGATGGIGREVSRRLCEAGARLVVGARTKESVEELRDVLDTNLVSAFAAARAGVRGMEEGDGGSIVLFSTAAVRSGIPNHEAIAAAKGGVEGLTRAVAATYAPAGIRCNAVAPGLTRTPGAERIFGSETAREASRAMHPLGRLGEPEDIASAVLWLLHPDQSWVTGQVLGVDGGLGTLRRAPGR